MKVIRSRNIALANARCEESMRENINNNLSAYARDVGLSLGPKGQIENFIVQGNVRSNIKRGMTHSFGTSNGFSRFSPLRQKSVGAKHAESGHSTKLAQGRAIWNMAGNMLALSVNAARKRPMASEGVTNAPRNSFQNMETKRGDSVQTDALGHLKVGKEREEIAYAREGRNIFSIDSPIGKSLKETNGCA